LCSIKHKKAYKKLRSRVDTENSIRDRHGPPPSMGQPCWWRSVLG